MLFTLFLQLSVAVGSRMPAEISLELKGRILTRKLESYSYAKIVEKLSAQGNVVSKRTIRRVIARDKEEANEKVRPPKKLGPQCRPTARTKTLRKVSKAVKKPPAKTSSS